MCYGSSTGAMIKGETYTRGSQETVNRFGQVEKKGSWPRKKKKWEGGKGERERQVQGSLGGRGVNACPEKQKKVKN